MIIENLKYCQENKGLQISGYVIMSNHIHLLACAEEGNESLSGILRDFKKHTSKEIIKMINEIPESRKDWLLDLFKKIIILLSEYQKVDSFQQSLCHRKV